MPEEIIAGLERLPGAGPLERRRDGWWMDAPALDVRALAALMEAAGFRLSTLTGSARPRGESEVAYHFCRGPLAVNVKTQTHRGSLPSLAADLPAAAWAEREIHDLYAVEFTGHPGLDPLLRPAEFAPGMFRPE
ncbi:MAG TPA: NADH-quinone oxidoreductase subunit C [Anaerolineae bacterium]